MTVKIHNTMSGRKESFEPLVSGTVRMYVCGVTVYDYCHLGHARSALVFEVIRRYLVYRGFAVTFVKNFTDVDDKIIRRAQEQGKDWQQITSTYIRAYHEDMRRIGVEPPTVEPKATDHMDDIIQLVGLLIKNGMAYQVDGDVYFQVENFPAYGMLSKRKLEDLQAGQLIASEVRALRGPALSEDPSFAVAAGKPLVGNATHLRNLYQSGLWDPTPMVDDLSHHRYAIVILDAELYPEPVLAAIGRFYFLDRSIRVNGATYRLFLPGGQ